MKRSKILMLEHDEDDRYITKAFFDEGRYPLDIDFVHNSNEFSTYLEQCPELPALIMVNQHAVPMNAVELLKMVKSNPAHRHIPVVVLSGTSNEEMIRECYASGASSFIQKPAGHAETDHKISSFIRYWFETVELA